MGRKQVRKLARKRINCLFINSRRLNALIQPQDVTRFFWSTQLRITNTFFCILHKKIIKILGTQCRKFSYHMLYKRIWLNIVLTKLINFLSCRCACNHHKSMDCISIDSFAFPLISDHIQEKKRNNFFFLKSLSALNIPLQKSA